jgi:hypothetical protein
VVIDEKDLNHGEPFEVDVARFILPRRIAKRVRHHRLCSHVPAIDDEQRAAADDVTIPLQRRVTLPAKPIH